MGTLLILFELADRGGEGELDNVHASGGADDAEM
jgi:hypothetical protein